MPPSSAPPPHGGTTSRRTVLAVALGGAAVATGCTSPADDATPGGAPSGTITPTAPAVEADTVLVEAAIARIAAADRVVAAAARGSQPLRRRLAPLRRLHRAHLAALEAGTPGRGTAPDDDDGPPLERVQRAEQRLQTELADAAVAARSGALASLFASMSAGVAQHLVTL